VATVDMGRKEGGGCCAPFAGAGTPSSTMWPGPRSSWLRGPAVEHWSLADVLSLSCA